MPPPRTNPALRSHPSRALLPIRPDPLRGAGDELATLQRGPKRLNDLRNHPPSEDHRQHSNQRVLRRCDDRADPRNDLRTS